jgi:hypothetical protein
LLLQMPADPLRDLLPTACSWLQKPLSRADQSGGLRYLALWDRFAGLAYEDVEPEENDAEGADLGSEALKRPGGVLAWTLVDALHARQPKRNTGLPADLEPRFSRIAAAESRPGRLGRIYFAGALAYLDAIDPTWTQNHFVPRLAWDHPEALPLWRSASHSNIGSAALFNALKPAMLAAFEGNQLSENEFEGLVSKLLSVVLWHQRGEAAEFELTAAEMRRALTVGPSSARRNVAWNLWRVMGQDDEEPGNKATRWRTIVGPAFQAIWPLDARLRSKETTRSLVLMTLECGEAFPEAVEAILDLIVPYQLYQIAHSLRLEANHSELVRQYPLAFVKLTNSLIDPALFAVPSDLAGLLQECLAADPSIADDDAYVRLYGLRRQRNA